MPRGRAEIPLQCSRSWAWTPDAEEARRAFPRRGQQDLSEYVDAVHALEPGRRGGAGRQCRRAAGLRPAADRRPVIGVNAGHTFSFVREAAEELRWAAVAAEDSQFRSRDLFPRRRPIALGQPDALADELRREDVLEVPAHQVAYVDGYGNLKTTIEQAVAPAPSGAVVRVRIGGVELAAIISDGSFAVERGQLALAPGSSGWADPNGGQTCWMELLLRGGNAREAFGHPPIGAAVHVDHGGR